MVAPARGNRGQHDDRIVGRAAYETAVRLYPRDVIQYREGARIIARSEPKAS
jgi:hypothetical protein